jgi:hypothetical protein
MRAGGVAPGAGIGDGDPFRLRIRFGDEDVTPGPTGIGEIGDRGVIQAGGAQGLTVQFHPLCCRFVALHVHHERPASPGDVQHAVLGRGGADNVWVRLRIRHRPERREPQIEERAMMFERFALPGLEHDRFGFFEPRLRLGVIDAEALVIIDVVGGTAAQSDDQPAF